MPTIIIKVDLECYRCHAKIKKVLDRITEKGEFVIDDIKYEKNDRVIVSGPFDADKLADKLCCKACNIIKEIEIVEPEPLKREELKPPLAETEKKPPPPADKTVKKPPPSPPPQPPKVIEVPYPCPYPYPFPAWPSGCCCHHGHGGCHCVRQDPPPAPAPQYVVLPPYPCGGYTVVCEEDPPGACAIM
ncbi:unnamed protein product [Alopecurus aequalis]